MERNKHDTVKSVLILFEYFDFENISTDRQTDQQIFGPIEATSPRLKRKYLIGKKLFDKD